MPRRHGGAKSLTPHEARLRHVCDMDAADVTDAQVRNARRAYYGAISYVDEQHRRGSATALRQTGLADNTLIVVTSDHGEMLGERGLWYKMSFFEGERRVPLIVHAPRRFAPRRVAAAVSLVDLLPTFVEIAGGDAGRPRGADRRAQPRSRTSAARGRRTTRRSANIWPKARSRRSS